MNQIEIRKARETDYEAVAELLRSASLPIAGVAEHFQYFLVAENGDACPPSCFSFGRRGVVGAIGLEVYDDVALLRSAVVKSSEQNKGVGSELYYALVEDAKSLGVQRLILLTNTAQQYFARKGFRKIDERSVTGPIRTSVEFTGACPSHAACMDFVFPPSHSEPFGCAQGKLRAAKCPKDSFGEESRHCLTIHSCSGFFVLLEKQQGSE